MKRLRRRDNANLNETTIRHWRNAAIHRLAGPDAHVDSLWMLADALHKSPTQLRLMMDEPLDASALEKLNGWLDARVSGVPLSYVQGRAYFMGHAFCVDPRVLIPRQDTELLCEQAIERARRGCPDVLELCTGSGAVAVSIALSCPHAHVTATDLSPLALSVARENAAQLGASVTWLEGDLFEPVAGQTFDVIVCNPPYLSRDDMQELQLEVRHEPELALYGGEDGLDFYRRAAAQVRAYLNPGGLALFEVGAGQARAVNDLLGGACRIEKDLNHIERVVALEMGAV